tara:strand:+ start:2566 stop:3936 length:1371 start_codon:yes stop_codon:yes gene_type:complete
MSAAARALAKLAQLQRINREFGRKIPDKILKSKTGKSKAATPGSSPKTKLLLDPEVVALLAAISRKTPADISKMSKKEIAELIEDKFPINFGRPHGKLTAQGPPLGPDVVKSETGIMDAITKLRGRRNVPPPRPMGPPTAQAVNALRLMRQSAEGSKKAAYTVSSADLEKTKLPKRLATAADIKKAALRRQGTSSFVDDVTAVDLDNYARVAAMGDQTVRKELLAELRDQLPKKEYKFFVERLLALGGDAPMGTMTLNPTALTNLAKLKPQSDFVAKMARQYKDPNVDDVIKNLKDDRVDQIRQEAVSRISSEVSNPLKSIVYASMTSPVQKRPTEIATGLFGQLREVGGVQVGSRNYGIADFSSKPKVAVAGFGKAMRQNPDFKKAAVMSQEFPDNKKLRERRFREAMDNPIETPVTRYVKSDDQYQLGTASLPALQDLADIDTLRRILGAPRTP